MSHNFFRPRQSNKPKGDKNKNQVQNSQDGSGTIVTWVDDEKPVAVPVLPSSSSTFNKGVSSMSYCCFY